MVVVILTSGSYCYSSVQKSQGEVIDPLIFCLFTGFYSANIQSGYHVTDTILDIGNIAMNN